MRVRILFSAIGDYMPKYQRSGENLKSLANEITHKAKEVWNTRQPGESAVSFLQKMPTKYGVYFRFLEVTQKDENTLQVSTRSL